MIKSWLLTRHRLVSLLIYQHQQQQVTQQARISLTLYLSPSVPIIHRSWQVLLCPCRAVLGRPTLARPRDGVHRRTLMISSLLLQHCPAYFVHLTWMVLEMGGRWLYNCCFVRCCFKDLFSIARNFLVQFPSSFFSIRFTNFHVLHPYSRIDTVATWKVIVHFMG